MSVTSSDRRTLQTPIHFANVCSHRMGRGEKIDWVLNSRRRGTSTKHLLRWRFMFWGRGGGRPVWLASTRSVKIEETNIVAHKDGQAFGRTVTGNLCGIYIPVPQSFAHVHHSWLPPKHSGSFVLFLSPQLVPNTLLSSHRLLLLQIPTTILSHSFSLPVYIHHTLFRTLSLRDSCFETS